MVLYLEHIDRKKRENLQFSSEESFCVQYFNEYFFWFVQEFHVAIAFVCTRICICFHFSPEHVFDLISFSLALSHCRDVIHPTLLRLISLYNVMYMICYCFETVFRQKNTTKKTQYYPNRKLFRQKESHSTFDCSRCGWCMRAYAFDMENKSTTNLATVSNNSKMTEGKKNTTKHKTQVNVPPTSFMSHGSLRSSDERERTRCWNMFSGMAE